MFQKEKKEQVLCVLWCSTSAATVGSGMYWYMYFSFCVHMMVENNNKTMGLADCSDNLVLPSCRKNTSVKHVKKMQSSTLNKSAKVTWTRVKTHAGEKLPLWRNKSSDGDRIIKSPKSVRKYKRNTHKPQKYQQTWNKSNIKQVWSACSAVYLKKHADTKDGCL